MDCEIPGYLQGEVADQSIMPGPDLLHPDDPQLICQGIWTKR